MFYHTKKYLLPLLFFFLFISSCKKDKSTSPIDMGKNYFPLHLNHSIIYEVDSTVYDEFTFLPKTYRYQVKEIITQAFTNDEATTSYRLERYIKYYDSTKTYDQIPWQIKDVWTITPYPSSIEKTEENIAYVKLIFPIKKAAQWNGNVKNTIGEKTYTYEYIHNSEYINNIYFDSVLQVKQYEYRSLIQYQNEIEKYAKNIGLVYKEITRLESQTIIPSVPVENRVEKGFIYKMKVIDWEK